MIGFLIGIALYAAMVLVSYNPEIKGSPWYMPIGLGLAILTNCIWLWMIQSVSDKGQIMSLSFTWESIKLLSFAVIPVLFLGAPIEASKIIACLLIGCGMYLLNQ